MQFKKQHSTSVLIIDSILALIFIVCLVYFFEIKNTHSNQASLVRENATENSISSINHLTLIIASTTEEQQLGLGERASLPENEGMLFIFPEPGNYGFWMKDMQFPIDMIWMDSNFTITHIESNVSPDTYPHSFYPDASSSYVLETNAGYSQNNNLAVGETLDFIRNSLQNKQ